MSSTLPTLDRAGHRLVPETRPRMAKADLRKAEHEDWPRDVGEAIAAVMHAQQLSLKEFAAKVGRNERQVARWFEGKENPQLAAIFAVVEFRQPLLLALARLAGEQVQIDTTITIRSIA